MNDSLKNDVTYEKTGVEDKTQGKNIFHAPQPALTLGATGSAGGTYNGTAKDVINNNKARIADIETALIKLGLLRHP